MSTKDRRGNAYIASRCLSKASLLQLRQHRLSFGLGRDSHSNGRGHLDGFGRRFADDDLALVPLSRRPVAFANGGFRLRRPGRRLASGPVVDLCCDGGVLREEMLAQVVPIVDLTAYRAGLAAKISSFAVWIVWAVVQFVRVNAAARAFFSAIEAAIDLLPVSTHAPLRRRDLPFFHKLDDARVGVFARIHLQERAKDECCRWCLCARAAKRRCSTKFPGVAFAGGRR